MSTKHNHAIVFLVLLGLGVTAYFIWQTIALRQKPAGNPYAGLTRPVFYPESPYEGNDGSKLQVFEFGDFACPACREMQGVVEQIFAKYGNRLVHVWKDFPVHPDISRSAAIAARCAARPGKFWPYHDWLFANQADIKKLSWPDGAKSLGLDEAKFNACLGDKKVLDYIERDFLEGQALGVQATPAFVVGNQAFAGVVSYEDFEKIVLVELANIK